MKLKRLPTHNQTLPVHFGPMLLSIVTVTGIVLIVLLTGGTVWNAVFGGIIAFIISRFLWSYGDVHTSQVNPANPANPYQAVSNQSGQSVSTGTEKINALAAGILYSLKDPALLITSNGKISDANPAAQTLFKISPDSYGPLARAIRSPYILSGITNVIKRQKPIEIEWQYSPEPNGIVYNCIISPIKHDSRVSVIIVLQDLTLLKRAERARADFLAHASHELRTPLASLSGFIETMQGSARNDIKSHDKFLKIMQTQTERMHRLVMDLLSLSRIELSQTDPISSHANMTLLLYETVDALRPLAKLRDITLKIKCSTEEIWVQGTQDELVQVVQNLIDNAIKYSDKGSIIDIRLAVAEDEKTAHDTANRKWQNAARISFLSPAFGLDSKFVVLRISDSGKGIAREHLPRLSQRFYRVEKDRTSDPNHPAGIGIGLAIVKHIMARHRGGFGVESIENEGTAFGIWLPLCQAKAKAKKK